MTGGSTGVHTDSTGRPGEEGPSPSPVDHPVQVPAGYRVGLWEVVAPIDSGSWGTVYEAVASDGLLARSHSVGEERTTVALKFLPSGTLTPRQHVALAEMVQREIRFSQFAEHPRLIRTYQTLTVEDPDNPALDGAVVLVMDRAVHSLQHRLLAAEPGRPLPDAERILTQICEGLAYMHAAGWVHGDIKPANVLLMPDGSVRLSDFGLTAEIDGTHAYGPRIASFDYVPPEWWTERIGAQGIALRTTCDTWAFGILAHQVLSGGLFPFPGGSARARALAAQSYAIGSSELRLHPAVPARWRPLITDCLSPDHAGRAQHPTSALLNRISSVVTAATPRTALGWALNAVASRLSWSMATPLAAAAVVTALLVNGSFERPVEHKTGPAGLSVPFTGGALSPNAPVPAAYLPFVRQSKKACSAKPVTEALIAAIIKAETNFDPKARNFETVEYGIAKWTPWLFGFYAIDADGDGKASYESPADSIVTVGQYLCWLNEQFNHYRMPGDRAQLLAAGYRNGSDAVIRERGVPARTLRYVREVQGYMRAFTDGKSDQVTVVSVL